MTRSKNIEGPWVDDDGNECLDMWADEGGVMLQLQRTKLGRVSFYVYDPYDGSSSLRATIAPLRWERIREFLTTT